MEVAKNNCIDPLNTRSHSANSCSTYKFMINNDRQCDFGFAQLPRICLSKRPTNEFTSKIASGNLISTELSSVFSSAY